MNSDYWIDTVEKLKNKDTATWAAQALSTGLGQGRDPERTNLGEALKCVPREEIILGTLLAYQDWSAKSCCDQILWYFEPEEIVAVYKNLPHANEAIRNGVRGFLEKIESPLSGEV
jgi:hypothetical protein